MEVFVKVPKLSVKRNKSCNKGKAIISKQEWRFLNLIDCLNSANRIMNIDEMEFQT